MYPAAHMPFIPAHRSRPQGRPSVGLGAAGHVRSSRGLVPPISVCAIPAASVVVEIGVDVAGYCLTGLAFGLAAFNASTGLCLGCKAYLLIRRLLSA